MAEVELGLYHYKLIYSIVKMIETTKNIENVIPKCLETIYISLKPDIFIFLKTEPKIYPYISYGIDNDKITGFNWEDDGLISNAINYKIPIKIDSFYSDKKFSSLNIILVGMGYKLEAFLVVPVVYNNILYGMFFLANRSKAFTPHEYETLKIIANQISYHMEINKLKDEAEKKCQYFSLILNNMSSAIIIYSENGIKFINKKAKEILEEENLSNNKFIDLVNSLFNENKNKSRMEIAINVNNKEKIIGYSCVFINTDFEKLMILVFQDITKYKISV